MTDIQFLDIKLNIRSCQMCKHLKAQIDTYNKFSKEEKESGEHNDFIRNLLSNYNLYLKQHTIPSKNEIICKVIS